MFNAWPPLLPLKPPLLSRDTVCADMLLSDRMAVARGSKGPHTHADGFEPLVWDVKLGLAGGGGGGGGNAGPKLTHESCI